MTAKDNGVVHSTFVIERSYPKPPARVFAAFAEPEQKRKWYAQGDHDIQEFEMDFRVGGSGRFRYRFREGHPLAGSQILNESNYQDIVPDKRIVMTSKMSLSGTPVQVMLATIEFLATETGTDLIFTHQGTFINWQNGPGMLEEGWRALFGKLEKELMN